MNLLFIEVGQIYMQRRATKSIIKRDEKKGHKVGGKYEEEKKALEEKKEALEEMKEALEKMKKALEEMIRKHEEENKALEEMKGLFVLGV